MLHDSARLGAMLLPGIGLTSASWVAESTMNGVPWMVSAGSNQVGTSVVCTAHVIWPSGAAAAGPVIASAMRRGRTNARLCMAVLRSGDCARRQRRHVVDDAHGEDSGTISDRQLVARQCGDVDTRARAHFLGHHERAGVLLGELLEPGGDVDGVADGGELGAVAVAHAADDGGTGVDADSNAKRRRPLDRQLAVQG